MTPANLKQKILKTVEEMPQDVSFEEVMERLYFLYKIEQGLQQVETDSILSHQQAKQNSKNGTNRLDISSTCRFRSNLRRFAIRAQKAKPKPDFIPVYPDVVERIKERYNRK